MLEPIKWPSIGHFRHVVSSVAYHTQFTGKVDEQGASVLDTSIPLPKLRFRGTVKLHGCNAGVIYDALTGELASQGREIILTPELDGYKFYPFALEREDLFKSLCRQLAAIRTPEIEAFLAKNPGAKFAVFGEWCGQGVQKKCAVGKLEKLFVIFRAGFAGALPDETSRDDRPFMWIPPAQVAAAVATEGFGDARIFHIEGFPVYDRVVDFNNPDAFLAEAAELTAQVEQRCPVGAAFGIDGIGEGIVWECVEPGWTHPRFTFKVKGEKHKVSKTDNTTKVDPEVAANVEKFVEMTATAARMEQGQSVLAARGVNLDKSTIGEFLGWVARDILKEEADLIAAANVDVKLLTKAINKAATAWLREQAIL
jgi:hypothetical protein